MVIVKKTTENGFLMTGGGVTNVTKTLGDPLIAISLKGRVETPSSTG